MTNHAQQRCWARSVAAGAVVLQEFLLRARADAHDAYNWLGIEPPGQGVTIKDDMHRLADALAAKTKEMAKKLEA